MTFRRMNGWLGCPLRIAVVPAMLLCANLAEAVTLQLLSWPPDKVNQMISVIHEDGSKSLVPRPALPLGGVKAVEQEASGLWRARFPDGAVYEFERASMGKTEARGACDAASKGGSAQNVAGVRSLGDGCP